jgi:hypothetical protein
LTHDAVQRCLDAYVEAWRTYDPAAIGALFAEDATYTYHPYDEGEEVVRGREAIVTDWLEEQDEPGTWEGSYRPLVVEGQRAVAEGTTSYTNGDFFWNLGRCASTRRTDALSLWSGSWSGRGAERSSDGRMIGREATLDRTSTPRFFPYSPECVEEEFCELRGDGVLGSSIEDLHPFAFQHFLGSLPRPDKRMMCP